MTRATKARANGAAEGSHEFVCDECGFRSTGWPTAKAAKTRKAEHDDEHKTGNPAPELADSEASK